jgi:hypothetical protein
MSGFFDEHANEMGPEAANDLRDKGFQGLLSDFPAGDVEVVSPTVAAKGLSEGVQPVAGCPPFTLEGKHDASYCTH